MNRIRNHLAVWLLSLAVSLVMLFPADAHAQSAVIEELKNQVAVMQQQMKQLMERIEQLEKEKTVEAEPAPAPAQQPQTILGALNPAISVITNFVARGDTKSVRNSDGDRVDNKFNIREAELDLRAPIDPYADGVLIASLESASPGKFSASIEEGYVNIKKLPFLDEPPLGMKLKVGRFRPAFGKFNILHTHDLPTTFRSLPTEEFMGEEGFIENGGSANFFIPTPWDEESSLDATIEVMNGGDVAISPKIKGGPASLGHLRWYRTFRDAHSLELGWSSYVHPDGGAGSADFHGLDFLYRWKPLRQGEYQSFLFGGESMFARRAYPHADEPADVAHAIKRRGLEPGQGTPWGYSLFGQWQFNQRTYAGLRWDQTTTLFNPNLMRMSLTPYLSYYLSEFLRARLSYEHRWSDFFTENNRNSFFFELNWVFGSHPPEPFWVNK